MFHFILYGLLIALGIYFIVRGGKKITKKNGKLKKNSAALFWFGVLLELILIIPLLLSIFFDYSGNITAGMRAGVEKAMTIKAIDYGRAHPTEKSKTTAEKLANQYRKDAEKLKNISEIADAKSLQGEAEHIGE